MVEGKPGIWFCARCGRTLEAWESNGVLCAVALRPGNTQAIHVFGHGRSNEFRNHQPPEGKDESRG